GRPFELISQDLTFADHREVLGMRKRSRQPRPVDGKIEQTLLVADRRFEGDFPFSVSRHGTYLLRRRAGVIAATSAGTIERSLTTANSTKAETAVGICWPLGRTMLKSAPL